MTRLLLALALLASTAALAQAQPLPKVDARGQPVVIIDVEADVIYGDLHRPDHTLVPGHPKPTYKSLITLRKDFRGEMLATGSHL